MENEWQTLFIPPKPPFPNNALPVLVYPGALQPPYDYEALFHENGWQGIWTNGVYGFHHFHATAHEALGVHSGWARVQLGGPEGQEVRVQAGDAVLLPAGTGHKLLEASRDFSVTGAYPPGQSPDMERGDAKRLDACVASIRNVPIPARDPVYADGPAARWASFNQQA